jgi:hypothetical protein
MSSSLIVPGVDAESASGRSESGVGPKTWKTTTRALAAIDHASTKSSISSGLLKSWRA